MTPALGVKKLVLKFTVCFMYEHCHINREIRYFGPFYNIYTFRPKA